MNNYLSKEEAEEYYNKLWLENRELIQENIDRIYKMNCALERLLIDKDKEIEKLEKAIEYIEERFAIENGEYYLTHTFDKCNVKELYDILRGDKE